MHRPAAAEEDLDAAAEAEGCADSAQGVDRRRARALRSPDEPGQGPFASGCPGAGWRGIEARGCQASGPASGGFWCANASANSVQWKLVGGFSSMELHMRNASEAPCLLNPACARSPHPAKSANPSPVQVRSGMSKRKLGVSYTSSRIRTSLAPRLLTCQ